MQAVMGASKKRFIIDAQSDPVEFWSWLLNALHSDLTGGKPKRQSIITKCFQVRVSGKGKGRVRVVCVQGGGRGSRGGRGC